MCFCRNVKHFNWALREPESGIHEHGFDNPQPEILFTPAKVDNLMPNLALAFDDWTSRNSIFSESDQEERKENHHNGGGSAKKDFKNPFQWAISDCEAA